MPQAPLQRKAEMGADDDLARLGRERWLAEFARIESMLPGGAVPWLARLRRTALDDFAQHGFPTTRDEEWKYTNVAPVERRGFQAASADGGTARSEPLEALLASNRFP